MNCMAKREPGSKFERIVDFGLPSEHIVKNNCKAIDCLSCGWNPTENQRRIEYIRKYGLKKQPSGLWAYEEN